LGRTLFGGTSFSFSSAPSTSSTSVKSAFPPSSSTSASVTTSARSAFAGSSGAPTNTKVWGTSTEESPSDDDDYEVPPTPQQQLQSTASAASSASVSITAPSTSASSTSMPPPPARAAVPKSAFADVLPAVQQLHVSDDDDVSAVDTSNVMNMSCGVDISRDEDANNGDASFNVSMAGEEAVDEQGDEVVSGDWTASSRSAAPAPGAHGVLGRRGSELPVAHLREDSKMETKSSGVWSPLPLEHVDGADHANAQEVAEYIVDIIDTLRGSEEKFAVPSSFLVNHKINGSLREEVINWLVGVHYMHNLKQETLYLSVNYFDRALHRRPNTSQHKLQLLASTALFLANKYEESWPVHSDKLVEGADGAFTREHLLVDSYSLYSHFASMYGFVDEMIVIHCV
jgi:hypothetical protein